MFRKYMPLIGISILLISLLVVIATNISLIYAQNVTRYKAKLVGEGVIPTVNTSASGLADVNIGGGLWWKLNLTGINDPTMAHIHMGQKGVNGPIVVDLLNSSHRFENTTDRMIITGNNSALSFQGPMKGKTLTDIQSAIRTNTVGLYVDLHTRIHPNGELRGTVQLKNASVPLSITNK